MTDISINVQVCYFEVQMLIISSILQFLADNQSYSFETSNPSQMINKDILLIHSNKILKCIFSDSIRALPLEMQCTCIPFQWQWILMMSTLAQVVRLWWLGAIKQWYAFIKLSARFSKSRAMFTEMTDIAINVQVSYFEVQMPILSPTWEFLTDRQSNCFETTHPSQIINQDIRHSYISKMILL